MTASIALLIPDLFASITITSEGIWVVRGNLNLFMAIPNRYSYTPSSEVAPSVSNESERSSRWIDRRSARTVRALGAVSLIAGAVFLSMGSQGMPGDEKARYHSSINFARAEHCFTPAEKQYTTSLPHDNPQATERAVRCMVITLFGRSQLPYALRVYNRESGVTPGVLDSGFQDGAVNPKGGACGYVQADQCSKIGDYTKDDYSLEAQSKWGAWYIEHVYDSDYAKAWSSEQTRGYY
jgi:hypothetical protein